MNTFKNAKFIEAQASVRYWEDSIVNGKEDVEGNLMPLRKGDVWKPVIDLKTGTIQNWPKGTTAEVHYKVCDAGEYWLLDENLERIAKWKGYYVPDDFYCPNAEGWGDYIIMYVNQEGQIRGWSTPEIESSEWNVL